MRPVRQSANPIPLRLTLAPADAALGWRHVPLSRLRTLKVRSTEVTDASLGRLLSLCAATLERLDISYTPLKTLDFVSSALHTLSEWRLAKLVASGLPLTLATLEGFFRPLSERPDDERRRFRTLKLGAMPALSTKVPGLNDAILAKLMPYLEKLDGLDTVSLFQNWSLGKLEQPLARFIEVIGRRCTVRPKFRTRLGLSDLAFARSILTLRCPSRTTISKRFFRLLTPSSRTMPHRLDPTNHLAYKRSSSTLPASPTAQRVRSALVTTCALCM